jgi:uncharacterized protein YdhG (YjbR/CyaY superfamily)
MRTSEKIATIREYISLQPKEVQKGLKELYQIVKQNAPGAEVVISYGMPAFKLHGILLYFAAASQHYGFYAMPGAIKEFKDRLENYGTSKGTIRFPFEKPLPKKLIADIVKYRVKENLQREALKKAKKVKQKNKV